MSEPWAPSGRGCKSWRCPSSAPSGPRRCAPISRRGRPTRATNRGTPTWCPSSSSSPSRRPTCGSPCASRTRRASRSPRVALARGSRGGASPSAEGPCSRSWASGRSSRSIATSWSPWSSRASCSASSSRPSSARACSIRPTPTRSPSAPWGAPSPRTPPGLGRSNMGPRVTGCWGSRRASWGASTRSPGDAPPRASPATT
jgi:hypothetical protein